MENLVCERCGSEIPDFDFPKEIGLEIDRIVREEHKLFAVKTMRDRFGIDHAKSKQVISHFNAIRGQCHRCGYVGLEGQGVTCPKCKSFNYNIDMSEWASSENERKTGANKS